MYNKSIITMSMKKVLLPFLFISLVHSVSFSQVLYSSTTSASRFNPGVGAAGTPIVAYDDVTIPATTADGSDSISITKVNVGIRRAPNAPATNVSVYYTPLTNDQSGAPTMENATHVFLGKISLPANGSSLVTSIVSLGDSATALFKLKADASGQQKFLIGASFDNPSPANGIILTRAAEGNLDSLWIDNADSDKGSYATNFNNRLPASYYLQVFGNTTPTQLKAEKSFGADVAVTNIPASIGR